MKPGQGPQQVLQARARPPWLTDSPGSGRFQRQGCQSLGKATALSKASVVEAYKASILSIPISMMPIRSRSHWSFKDHPSVFPYIPGVIISSLLNPDKIIRRIRQWAPPGSEKYSCGTFEPSTAMSISEISVNRSLPSKKPHW